MPRRKAVMTRTEEPAFPATYAYWEPLGISYVDGFERFVRKDPMRVLPPGGFPVPHPKPAGVGFQDPFLTGGPWEGSVIARPWEVLPWANAVEAFALWGPDASGVAEVWEWLVLATAPVVQHRPPTKDDGDLIDFDWRKTIIWRLRNLPREERQAFVAWLLFQPFFAPSIDWAPAARARFRLFIADLAETLFALERSARAKSVRNLTRRVRERRSSDGRH